MNALDRLASRMTFGVELPLDNVWSASGRQKAASDRGPQAVGVTHLSFAFRGSNRPVDEVMEELASEVFRASRTQNSWRDRDI